MKITSTALAWVCVALLVLYPVSAILVWAYLSPESYGIMAALLTPGNRPVSQRTCRSSCPSKEAGPPSGCNRRRPDPHIETFDYQGLSGLTQEVLPVIERARSKWEDTPKYPAHARPAPPARRRDPA